MASSDSKVRVWPSARHEGDIAAADHQTIRRMERHAADAAPLGHDRRHLVGAIQEMHAAIDDIAEVETARRIPYRAFDQAEASATRCMILPGRSSWRRLAEG
jgi:hypothetical protein